MKWVLINAGIFKDLEDEEAVKKSLKYYDPAKWDPRLAAPVIKGISKFLKKAKAHAKAKKQAQNTPT